MILKKKLLMSLMTVSVSLWSVQSEAKDQAGVAPLKTLEQQASYAIGQSVAKNVQQNGLPMDVDAIAQALKDVRDGTPARLSEAEMRTAMQSVQQQAMAKQQAMKAEAGKRNLAAGEAFLLANKAKSGVVVTASGLQYRVLKAGTGAKPKASDTVTVHYAGKLIDGTEFDSSYARKEPTSFGVGGVIPGWTEALQLMPKGSKWQLVIPAKLAYGENGTGPIPPNSTLVFDVELLDIK